MSRPMRFQEFCGQQPCLRHSPVLSTISYTHPLSFFFSAQCKHAYGSQWLHQDCKGTVHICISRPQVLKCTTQPLNLIILCVEVCAMFFCLLSFSTTAMSKAQKSTDQFLLKKKQSKKEIEHKLQDFGGIFTVNKNFLCQVPKFHELQVSFEYNFICL